MITTVANKACSMSIEELKDYCTRCEPESIIYFSPNDYDSAKCDKNTRLYTPARGAALFSLEFNDIEISTSPAVVRLCSECGQMVIGCIKAIRCRRLSTGKTYICIFTEIYGQGRIYCLIME